MNKYYDLPLQNIVRSKLNTQKSTFQLEQLISPINTEEPVQMDEDSRYNLPCRRNRDEFVVIQEKENRPAIVNNLFSESSPYLHKNSQSKEIVLAKVISVSTGERENLRIRVSSIYEKLLEENKRKGKQEQIFTEATFKPKELKRQLSNHHRSMGENGSKPKAYDKNHMGSQSKMNLRDKKGSEIAKKLDFVTGAKTKYQKILQEHFNPGFSSKRSEALTADQIRLSKICGKNSSVLKLKERLQPNFCSGKSPVEIKNLKEKLEMVQRSHELQRVTKPQEIKTKVLEAKKPIKQKEAEKQLKQCQSERWMSMNFHERQQRVLSNRKQKEVMGKQNKMEQEIKPCTFKPQLTRSKSQRVTQPEKNSYYAQYYQKNYRRY